MIQARSFAGMLEDAIRRYQNRTIEAAQVIEELIDLAKEMREDFARGQELGLNEDELAFYDALETNDRRGKGTGRRHSPDHRPGTRGRRSEGTPQSTGRLERASGRV